MYRCLGKMTKAHRWIFTIPLANIIWISTSELNFIVIPNELHIGKTKFKKKQLSNVLSSMHTKKCT